jgi:hypothetical protein
MNTYALLGHGCDVVSERAEEGLDTKIVPPGCIYITLAVCGFISWDLYKIIIAFKDKTIYNELMNPNENKEKLEEYFKITRGGQHDIHIHNPGDEYNDSEITFICDGKSNGQTFLVKSGIYKLGNIPDIKSELGDDSAINTLRTRSTIAYTKGMIETAYNGSLIVPKDLEDEYPSMENFKGRYSNSLKLLVSKIMELEPGIYYNFACRVPCSGRMSHTRFRRKASAGNNDINHLGEPERTSIQEREGMNRGRQLITDEWIRNKMKKFKEDKEKREKEKKRLRKLYKNMRSLKKGTTSKRRGLKATKSQTRRSPRKTPRKSAMSMNDL